MVGLGDIENLISRYHCEKYHDITIYHDIFPADHHYDNTSATV